MPPVGFEPTISAGERPQTYALDHAAIGTGLLCICNAQFVAISVPGKTKTTLHILGEDKSINRTSDL